MIKDIEPDDRTTTMTVLLKTGTRYENMDIPPDPMGDQERVISFWSTDKKLKIIPLSQVEYIEFNLK